jgi:hypothetical protein
MKSSLTATEKTAQHAPEACSNEPTATRKSVPVAPAQFERVAKIIEQQLTDEPRFVSAPLVLEALRNRPDIVHVRLIEMLKFGTHWVYEPMPNGEWLVIIDPGVWEASDALQAA